MKSERWICWPQWYRATQTILIIITVLIVFINTLQNYCNVKLRAAFLFKRRHYWITLCLSKRASSKINKSNVTFKGKSETKLVCRYIPIIKSISTVYNVNYIHEVAQSCSNPINFSQFFNLIWKNQIKRLMDGKAQILELVEQAITTYDQREEWCNKLEALKEKAAIDYRKHCLVRIPVVNICSIECL